MRKALWLTYAWVDNEDADVDFVVRKLEGHNIEVRLDRTRIVAGQRLWQQIDRNLQASDLIGFAIYATANSLRSEPCQEELAIALDRVLRQKGSDFPLIGIFPQPMERELIPSSIATRLYVSLTDNSWDSQVASAIKGEPRSTIGNVEPYDLKVHLVGNDHVYEIRPRDGIWQPAIVAVAPEQFKSADHPHVWAKGQPGFVPSMWTGAELPAQTDQDGLAWQGFRIDQRVDNTQSLYVRSSSPLKRITFGSTTQQYRIIF